MDLMDDGLYGRCSEQTPQALRTPPHSFSSLSLVLLGIGLIAAAPWLHAAPADFGSAFDKLLLAREHALEEAGAPVEEQYRQKLEKLLKEAAEAGDVETAVRIKDVIAKDHPPAGRTALEAEGADRW